MAKQLKKVICFFAPVEMYNQLHEFANSREISLSQLLRGLLRDFLRSQSGRESGDVQKSSNNGTNVSNP